jgi:hypothetical protein
MVPLSAIQVAFWKTRRELSFGSECDRGRRRESGRAEVWAVRAFLIHTSFFIR